MPPSALTSNLSVRLLRALLVVLFDLVELNFQVPSHAKVDEIPFDVIHVEHLRGARYALALAKRPTRPGARR